MLEIFLVIWITRKLSRIAKEKGRSGGWGALGAAGWIGGEIGGMLIGVMVLNDMAMAYACAIGGAIVGAIAAYVVVKNLAGEERIDGNVPEVFS